MLSILYLSYGLPWTILAVGGFLICIILGTALDFRFFFLALIWVFLFLPLMMAFLYFYYGLTPLTAFNSIPHKILFDDKELRVRVINRVEEENESEEVNTKDFVVDRNLFKELKTGGDYVLLFFNKNGWLWLPVDAFESFDIFKTEIENFTDKRYA